jgi:hypothetical protein
MYILYINIKKPFFIKKYNSMNNQISESSELLDLLKKYDDYIDDYVELPRFITQYIKEGEIISENLSCETEAVLTKEFDSFIRDIGSKNYIFVYLINYHFIDKDLILFRFAKLDIDFEHPKYFQKKMMIIRDEKINKILE